MSASRDDDHSDFMNSSLRKNMLGTSTIGLPDDHSFSINENSGIAKRIEQHKFRDGTTAKGIPISSKTASSSQAQKFGGFTQLQAYLERQ